MPLWPFLFLSADGHREDFPCNVYLGAKLLGHEVIIATLALRDNIRLFANEVPPLYTLLVAGDNSCWSIPFRDDATDLKCFTCLLGEYAISLLFSFVFFVLLFEVWQERQFLPELWTLSLKVAGLWEIPPTLLRVGKDSRQERREIASESCGFPQNSSPAFLTQASHPVLPKMSPTCLPGLSKPTPFTEWSHWNAWNPRGGHMGFVEQAYSPPWEMTTPSLSGRKNILNSPTQLHIFHVNQSGRKTSARGFWGGAWSERVRRGHRFHRSPWGLKPVSLLETHAP